MKTIDLKNKLYEICEDEHVYEDDFDLFESGLLDSFAIIELFNYFNDLGLNIYVTRISKERLRTPKNIQLLINEYSQN